MRAERELNIEGCPQNIPKNGFALPIDVFSVPDFHNEHCVFFVLNGIDDAIPPLPYSITIQAGKFFAPLRSWVTSKRSDTRKDFSQLFLGDALEILLNRFFEIDAI
jgi:hypothetical protein